MPRQTKATVESTKSTKKVLKNSLQDIDFNDFFKKFWDGLEDNWKTYLGFILLIIAVIILRQFLFGLAFLILGILLIAGFFDSKE